MKFLLLAIALLCFNPLIEAQTPLQLYGGKDHSVYLGCLNCDCYGASSIWNTYGTYGSKYNSNSIWNLYGTYGSNYSNDSPFNPYASDPPVIVDKDGGFHGYLTINEYKDKRADFGLVMTIYKYRDMIRDDVQSWYDKIFN